MSAICGFLSGGRPVDPGAGERMLTALARYPADVVRQWYNRELFFGCCVRHITPESVREILPVYVAEAQLAITADAILDNRAELFSALDIDPSRRAAMTDSQLILQAYRRWGQECPRQLIGDFAFAIWDERRQELFCAVDHAGTRTFYYHLSAELFAFSTLIQPLFLLPGINPRYEEAWIADFLAIPSVMHQLDPELTLYQNIYLLPAGHSLTLNRGSARKAVYWQAQPQSELVLQSDGEYEEALRTILGQAVRCRMRSIRPVGVMLSGGLDSSAVAAMAAKELAGEGRRLPAFSMTPMRDYRDWLPAGTVADETPFVEATRMHIGNLDVAYCRSEGRHSLSDMERMLDMLEQPYKIFENLFWIDDLAAAAQASGVGVLLHGSLGNITISWGDKQSHLLSLTQAGHWRTALREAWITSRRYAKPNRMLVHLLAALLLPGRIQSLLSRLTAGTGDDRITQLPPISPAFFAAAGVRSRFQQFGYPQPGSQRENSLEARLRLLRPAFFSHVGVLSTKQSLAHDLAMRDPTLDRRVIEFCLRVPDNQYVRNGRERFLIRRAMKDLLPDSVRLNERVRGRQSADLSQRLQPHWRELTGQIATIGENAAERRYLDIARIKRELNRYPVLPDDAADDASLRMLLRSLIFTRFLRNPANSPAT